MGIQMLTDADIRRAWSRVDHAIHPGDCSSCGSQEFRHWHGRSVCAYCRSVADAPSRTHPAWSVRCTDRLIITRPHEHAYARITTD